MTGLRVFDCPPKVQRLIDAAPPKPPPLGATLAAAIGLATLFANRQPAVTSRRCGCCGAQVRSDYSHCAGCGAWW